ncbi:MAG: 23S rRNA (adenine(2503)-C(2))-methyltransferase RlmN [Coriobacteriia bacterium]|nr:23S rRNA (adenine(2503)-C(2))-methyltransferase RlmN [Coriobacteriia bacterium]
MGQPSYRLRQLVRWLYGRGAVSFGEMTDLSAEFRDRLAARFTLDTPSLVDRQVSADGTRKYLWRFADGVAVESVGIPAAGRLTVCFSTQAGCAMGCSFCATGVGGLVRDLMIGEMIDQVRLVSEDFGERVTNVVAMGQGEPFADYDATLEALRLMNSPDGLGIGARHITVSTCGLLSGIRRFAEEPEQFTLAISLHSAVQETRDHLMPGVRGFTLPALREALRFYTETSGRRVTLEYALVDGVNDSDRELDALIGFTRGLMCHVNLIPVNPVPGTGITRPTDRRIREFADRLGVSGIETSVRTARGVDIDAACGQLSQRHAE